MDEIRTVADIDPSAVSHVVLGQKGGSVKILHDYDAERWLSQNEHYPVQRLDGGWHSVVPTAGLICYSIFLHEDRK